MTKGWTWAPRPAKKVAFKVPVCIREKIEKQAGRLIESELRPRHIISKPQANHHNYIVDIHSKWHRHYFYFRARYRCQVPHRLSEFFDHGFARLECRGGNVFNLSYMRHTGRWWKLYNRLSLEECLEAIRKQAHFLP